MTPELLRCTVMRGGTTRGFFFRTEDLPDEPVVRDQMLVSVVAGNELCQADGLGGNDLLLSKVALVSPSQRPGIDVDAVFGAITPGSARIKYGSNCGNLASAVGLYAFDEQLVRRPDVVRMFNPDSNSIVEARLMGENKSVAGMPATGTPVELAFVDPCGTIGRGLLPTGNAIDRLTLKNGQPIEATIVDSGAVYLFVYAGDAGLDSATMPLDAGQQSEIVETAEDLRGQAAVMMGLVKNKRDAAQLSPNVPKVAFVSPAVNGEVNLLARIVSSQSLHRAYAVTGAIATISAAVVPGSIVNRVVGEVAAPSPFSLRIGHPAGVIELRIDWRSTAGAIVIDRAYTMRTARRLMSGITYVPALMRLSANNG